MKKKKKRKKKRKEKGCHMGQTNWPRNITVSTVMS
jgi:hypothetical protein